MATPPKYKLDVNKAIQPKGPLPEDEQDMGYKVRKTVRDAISSGEDKLRNNPDHDVLGPVLANVAGMIKTMIPDPEQDTGVAMGAMPGRASGKSLPKSKTLDAPEELLVHKNYNKVKKLMGDEMQDIPMDKPLLRKKLLEEAEYDPASGLVNKPEKLKAPEYTAKYGKFGIEDVTKD